MRKGIRIWVLESQGIGVIIDHRQKKRNDRRPDRLKEKAPVAQFNLNSCKMKKINTVLDQRQMSMKFS